MDNCLLMLNNQLKNRIKVKIEYCDENVKLLGNIGKLHQVFINIFTNAVQSIDKEGVISVLTKRQKETITIEISDSGSGISKENLSQITVPFFTTKDPGEGTGLGLSIAYTIITEHKGTLSFESDPPKGTTVKISLPIM